MSDSEEEIKEKHMKLVFLGEPNVGKTCIIRRFCYDDFTRHYSQTVGAEFYIKRVELPEKKEITVRMSDVGGMEMKGHMLKNYLFNVNVIILVYDITDCESFENMVLWLDRIREDVADPLIAVFANKCDLEHKRAVRLDKTKKFIEEYGLHNFLISARTGENVDTYLTDIIAKYFGITLSRSERERRAAIVTAEIIPASPPRNTPPRSNSKLSVNGNSICSIQ